MSRPVIAVDGGGTRCRLSYDGRFEREIGPANVASDRSGAIDRLTEGLDALIAQAGGTPAPVYLALAGCISEEIAQAVRAALPFDILAVEDDRKAAICGALGARDGAVVHCGTGSFVGLAQAGAIRLAGGWGSVLGDEASANWVTRRSLARALDCCDALCPHSDLTLGLLKRFGGTAGIVGFAMSASPEEIAAIAPDITAAAAQNDPVASAVMQEGADYIARVLTQLGYQNTAKLCLTGGIGAEFAPYLAPHLRSCITQRSGVPLDGALRIARDLSESQRIAS